MPITLNLDLPTAAELPTASELRSVSIVPVLLAVTYIHGPRRGITNYHYFFLQPPTVQLGYLRGGGILADRPLLPESGTSLNMHREKWMCLNMGTVWEHAKLTVQREYDWCIPHIGLDVGMWSSIKTGWNGELVNLDKNFVDLIKLFLASNPTPSPGLPLIITPVVAGLAHALGEPISAVEIETIFADTENTAVPVAQKVGPNDDVEEKSENSTETTDSFEDNGNFTVRGITYYPGQVAELVPVTLEDIPEEQESRSSDDGPQNRQQDKRPVYVNVSEIDPPDIELAGSSHKGVEKAIQTEEEELVIDKVHMREEEAIDKATQTEEHEGSRDSAVFKAEEVG